MVIRGNTRGNGRQLAQYLLTSQGNERVQILDVSGRVNASDDYLHQTLQSMSLTGELTKSRKGLYHAQINPAYSEDRRMSAKDWTKAADILGKQLGLDQQRRVLVLHTKKGRTHAHVVWERYDHKTGKVISDSFSRLAQDRARKEMERVFEHQPTPHRNQHRPELKEALTKIWQQTETGEEFVKSVHERGYLLAEGVPRHPFMVVDENGRSFDLVRQLKGVRIKEVRQRMQGVELIPEKEAIELMRQRQEGNSDANKAERQLDDDKAKRTAAAFWDNKQDSTENTELQSRQRMKSVAASFLQSIDEMTEKAEEDSLEKKKNLDRDYILNADELTGNSKENEDAPEVSREADQKRYQDTLKEFVRSQDELVANDDTTDKQRQQERASQFFDNQDALAAKPTDADDLQRLMQEQKEIRQRSQQRSRRRTR